MEMALSLVLLISFVIRSSNGESKFFASSNIYVPGAVAQYTGTTNIECCTICSGMANCVASNWNSLTSECEILTADPAGRVPVNKQDWTVYTSDCPSLENPPNGKVVTTGTVLGPMATYTCDPPYYIPGLATRTCGLLAAWSSPTPVCQPLCPVELSMHHEDMCYQVYNDTKNWIDSRAFCRSKGADLITIRTESMFILLRDYSTKNKEYFWVGCKEQSYGHYVWVDGSTAIPSSWWLFAEPNRKGFGQCLHMFLINGVGLNDAPCHWTFGYVCGSKVCPFLETSNGTVVTTGFVEGSTATYMCDNSFHVVGVATRTCGSSGVWSGQIPYCRPECPFLEIANGTVVTTGFVEESTATYTCDNSYYLVGVATRICGSSGVWSGRIPVCQPECESSLSSYANTENVEGPSCLRDGCDFYAKCKLGFKQPPGLTGPVRFVCNALGYWNISSGNDCSYELMFRGTARNDIDIISAYTSGTGSTTNPSCMDVHNSTCNQHYRNVKMNVWDSLGITNVLYEMYEGGSTVMSVVFDAQGRTSTRWMGHFSALTIQSAIPWTNMVQGRNYRSSLLWERYIGRAFCIKDFNMWESICEKRYYTAVLVYSTSPCVDTTISSWPIFLYSDTIGWHIYPNQASNFREASTMAVWVQTTN